MIEILVGLAEGLAHSSLRVELVLQIGDFIVVLPGVVWGEGVDVVEAGEAALLSSLYNLPSLRSQPLNAIHILYERLRVLYLFLQEVHHDLVVHLVLSVDLPSNHTLQSGILILNAIKILVDAWQLGLNHGRSNRR